MRNILLLIVLLLILSACSTLNKVDRERFEREKERIEREREIPRVPHLPR